MLQKDLVGMYPLCMIVRSSGQGKVLPQEDRVPGGHVALQRGKTAVFSARLWNIVLCERQKFKLQLLVSDVSLMKASSNLVQVMVRRKPRERFQPNSLRHMHTRHTSRVMVWRAISCDSIGALS
ncbi:DDE_3 domain-containing protein [Trichonephila clavipes]|uniref:DDE_3 domain-containing protein n=1 Tax=Trichonephila clavipes TaxID=2585209 RepID=A0A8X6W334_TRICX|nr:DDE_3 domain-containing protein [Trichonephila clavipes]